MSSTFTNDDPTFASPMSAFQTPATPATLDPVVAAAAAASSAFSYGTSLPTTPAGGDLAVLVDSTTAPTYQWLFRYNATSASIYKWECVGGTPGSFGGGFTEVTFSASTAYQTPVTRTLPNSGDWLICAQATCYNAANFQNVKLVVAGADIMVAKKTGGLSHLTYSYVATALTATNTVSVQYQTSSAGDASFCWGGLQISPVRVI